MTIRRLIVAGSAAIASLFLLSPAVVAASHASNKAAQSTAAAGQPPAAAGQPASAATPTADRDVPGAAVDPSKKDHDNGVGNNCDPGFGKGNQAKFGTADQSVDPRDTGCRSASGTAKNHETEGQTKGQTEELTKGQTKELTEEQTEGQTEELTEGQTEELTEGQTEEQTE